MCFSSPPMPTMPPPPPPPPDLTQQKQLVQAKSVEDQRTQTEVNSGSSTMLTQGVGVDPETLMLGKKTLLG